jgi:hypothetical protein
MYAAYRTRKMGLRSTAFEVFDTCQQPSEIVGSFWLVNRDNLNFLLLSLNYLYVIEGFDPTNGCKQ